MQPEPGFLHAIRAISGRRGLDEYLPLEPPLVYRVPDGREAQCVYFRSGNSPAELICVVLTRNGEPMCSSRWAPADRCTCRCGSPRTC